MAWFGGRPLPAPGSFVLEAALFIALGFLVASLLALMIAPAIWRRAVVITRNRIEASVPLTLNEIQADKDQLRAEFAMSTRRLEMNLDKLRERASAQVIEVNRKRDELAKVAEEHRAKTAELEAAREEGRRLAADLKAREEKLAETDATLKTAQETLDARARQITDYETALRAATADVDSHREALKERDERLAALEGDDVGEAADGGSADAGIANGGGASAIRLRADLEAARGDAGRERERAERFEGQVDELRDRLSELEALVERRENDITRLRLAASEGGASAAEDAVAELRAENVKLEADLSAALLRAAKAVESPSRANGDAAADALRSENEQLRQSLEEARAELETQRIEIAAAQLAGRDGYESERRDNALVRERLNDLAARVTAMTAEMEGAASPIERIMEETPPPPRFSPEAYGTPDGAPPQSLAERIRALKRLQDEG